MSRDDPIDTIVARATDDMRGALCALDAMLPVRGDPADPGELIALLRMLYRIARLDLPLARLFEGHVDAIQIIARYADPAMAADGLLGVWNAALPGEPLRVEDGRLYGGKSFASGAGILSHAIVGADTPQGNRLLLVDLSASAPSIDRDWWQVVGMQRSRSHIVRWDGADRTSFRSVGEPGDYAREPYFSGGALRFVAAHAGGVAALFDHVRRHLTATERADEPHQSARLASLYAAASAAAAAVRDAAATWGTPSFVDHVAAARIAVADRAECAIVTAQQAVGVGGLFDAHPLSQSLTDLMVYLRQPTPDAQRMRVGKAAADGILVPDL